MITAAARDDHIGRQQNEEAEGARHYCMKSGILSLTGDERYMYCLTCSLTGDEWYMYCLTCSLTG